MRRIRCAAIILCLFCCVACAKRPPDGVPVAGDEHRILRSYLLSKVEAYQGDIDAALDSLHDALRDDPGNPHIETQIASLEADQGMIIEAMHRVQAVLQRHPDYIPALFLAGKIA